MPTERRAYLIVCLAKALGWDEIGVAEAKSSLATHLNAATTLTHANPPILERCMIRIFEASLDHLSDDRLGELVELAERGKLAGFDLALIKVINGVHELEASRFGD